MATAAVISLNSVVLWKLWPLGLAIGCHKYTICCARCIAFDRNYPNYPKNLRANSARVCRNLINFIQRMKSMIVDICVKLNSKSFNQMRKCFEWFSVRVHSITFTAVATGEHTMENVRKPHYFNIIYTLLLRLLFISLMFFFSSCLLDKKSESWLIAFTLRFQIEWKWNDRDACNISSGLAHKQLLIYG